MSNAATGVNDFTTVSNNIIVNMSNNVGTGGISLDPTACQPHNIWANNLMYGNTANFTGNGCSQTGTQTGSNSTTFVNYTGTISGDYHLKAGSTAINNGTTACALSGCAPSTDFDGKARPQGAAIDIGAYEQ
jgi:hypothetical protein